MDTFKGQDNDDVKRLCSNNNCELVIVPRNLTNKFQPLDQPKPNSKEIYLQQVQPLVHG